MYDYGLYYELSDEELREASRRLAFECLEARIARGAMDDDHEAVRARIARLLAR